MKLVYGNPFDRARPRTFNYKRSDRSMTKAATEVRISSIVRVAVPKPTLAGHRTSGLDARTRLPICIANHHYVEQCDAHRARSHTCNDQADLSTPGERFGLSADSAHPSVRRAGLDAFVEVSNAPPGATLRIALLMNERESSPFHA